MEEGKRVSDVLRGVEERWGVAANSAPVYWPCRGGGSLQLAEVAWVANGFLSNHCNIFEIQFNNLIHTKK